MKDHSTYETDKPRLLCLRTLHFCPAHLASGELLDGFGFTSGALQCNGLIRGSSSTSSGCPRATVRSGPITSSGDWALLLCVGPSECFIDPQLLFAWASALSVACCCHHHLTPRSHSLLHYPISWLLRPLCTMFACYVLHDVIIQFCRIRRCHLSRGSAVGAGPCCVYCLATNMHLTIFLLRCCCCCAMQFNIFNAIG